MTDSDIRNLSLRALATHYLNICNTALTQRKDELPYNAIIALLTKAFPHETINLKVIGAGGAAEYFTTRFIDGEFTPLQAGKQDAEKILTLERDYLEQVVQDSDALIAHPEKLDWSWITTSSPD